MASTIALKCLVVEEKDLILSHCLEWGSMVTWLGSTTNRTLGELTRVNLTPSEMSQEVMELAVHLH